MNSGMCLYLPRPQETVWSAVHLYLHKSQPERKHYNLYSVHNGEMHSEPHPLCLITPFHVLSLPQKGDGTFVLWVLLERDEHKVILKSLNETSNTTSDLDLDTWKNMDGQPFFKKLACIV